MNYFIQLNLYLALFYGFYYVFLRKETFYQLNRAYLVGSAVLSFGIPFWYSDYIQSWLITQQVQEAIYTAVPLQGVAVYASPTASPISWFDVLKAIYFSVLVFFFLKLIFNFYELNRLLKADNQVLRQYKAFSFFKFVFVDEDLQNQSIIMAHEQVHIRQLHSFDVVLFELIAVICWFNPVAHFYKKAIKNIHEYIADEIASKHEQSKAAYAMLLFSQQFGVELNPQTLTNHFFSKSTLKQRIEMLQKPRSRRVALLKYGFIVPLFMSMLIIASASIARTEPIETIKDLFKKAENKAFFGDKPTIDKKMKITGIVVNKATGKPLENVMVNLAKNERRVASVSTDNQGKFIFTDTPDVNRIVITMPDGYFNISISEIKNMQGLMEVISSDENGIDLKIYVDVKLLVKDPRGNVPPLPPAPPITNDSSEVFTSVEQNPEFPGGVKELYRFIGSEMRYPKEAQEKNIEGKVFLKLIIEKDGSVKEIFTLKGIGGGCEEEAIRVMKATSGKWTAGKQNGRPVRVWVTLPVKFALEEGKPISPESSRLSEVVITALRKDENEIKASKYPIEVIGMKEIGKEPLYVIDGKPIDKNEFNISPDEIATVNVIKGENAVAMFGEKGKNGIISFMTKKYASQFSDGQGNLPPQALYLLEGKETTKIIIDALNPESIASIDVYKSEAAIKLYGEKGKNGVVVVSLKK